MNPSVRVTLMVTSDDASIVARVAEQMVRTATGFALESIECSIFVGPEDAYDSEDQNTV